MSLPDQMEGSLQENILTLVCFDHETCKVIRNSVPIDLFENSIYRDVATVAYEFIDLYESPPCDHLPDLLEHILSGADKRKARLYERTLDELDRSKEGINSKFVMTQLRTFVRQQSLKSGITEAVKLLKEGDIEGADLALERAKVKEIAAFDPGTFIHDEERSLAFLHSDIQSFPSGIPEFDAIGVGPVPGELLIFVASSGKGKTWYMVHLGKYAMLHQKRVLHISLEMSEERVAQRYVQSFFSITKRAAQEVKYLTFEKSGGQFLGFSPSYVDDRPSFQDPKIEQFLRRQLAKQSRKTPFLIKQFPTSTLTMEGLELYLDSLERSHRFHPDLILLDYADLMSVRTDNLRLELGALLKQLRGLAVKRNLALVTASQGNRESSQARVVRESHIAEDWSKVGTADVIVTYSQTDYEKRLGLARLTPAKVRNDESGVGVLVSQAYSMGQFRMDSSALGEKYWASLDREEKDEDEEDDS